jgi:hypothetical protein
LKASYASENELRGADRQNGMDSFSRLGPVWVAVMLARFVFARSALSACSGSLDAEFTVSNSTPIIPRSALRIRCGTA